MEGFSSLDGVAQKVKVVFDNVTKPIEWMKETFEITASVGVAVAPRDGNDPTALMEAADASMYRAKAGGKNPARWLMAINSEDSKRLP